MARQIINVGTAPNDGTGDTLKTSFTKCNANFLELYSGSSITISGVPSTGQLAQWTSASAIQGVAPEAVGASMVLLSTVTATAAATVDFTSLLTSAFDEYEVHFRGVYSSSNADSFLCRVGESSVYMGTATYAYALNIVLDSAANAPAGNVGSGAGISLTFPNIVSNLAVRPISGKATIVAPLGTGFAKIIQFNSSHYNSNSALIAAYGSGAWLGDTNAIDSLRFMMITGTITGKFKLYGIR